MEAQVAFLLEKHRDSEKFCIEEFNDLLVLITDELAAADPEKDKEHAGKLALLHEMVTEQNAHFAKEIASDIGSLEHNLSLLRFTKELSDPEQQAELLARIKEDDEIQDYDTFKEAVDEEAEEAKAEFLNIMDDLKGALKDNNLDELLAYFEEIRLQQQESEQEAEEEEDEDEDESCASDSDCCAGKCTEGGCTNCKCDA